MAVALKDQVQEIKRLQRCIDNLVSVLALPAVWTGSEPSEIVQIVLDALVRPLSRDFAHARLKDPIATVPVEILRVGESCKLSAQPEKIPAMLGNWFGGDGHKSLPLRTHLGDADISIVLGTHRLCSIP